MSEFDPDEEPSPDEATYHAADEGTPTESPWDSDDAVDSLRMERTIYNESNEQLTKRLLEEAGPMAAKAILHIAMHDSNGNTRLRAATYIVDRAYGDDSSKSGKALWEQMVGDVVSDAELHANQGQG